MAARPVTRPVVLVRKVPSVEKAPLMSSRCFERTASANLSLTFAISVDGSEVAGRGDCAKAASIGTEQARKMLMNCLRCMSLLKLMNSQRCRHWRTTLGLI
jgi:hypothetical protein